MIKDNKTLRLVLMTACFLPAGQLSAEALTDRVSTSLIEPEGLYDSAAPTILNMRVKTVIQDGLCSPGEYAGCTLNDVLNDIDGSDDFKPEIKVHMTADDFPDDGLESNAELRQRGATSRGAPQKSFRVKLDSSDDLWRGERRIQLVKGFWDFSRIRNKLSYDLIADVPNLPSMQTQFVSFKVEDQGVVEDFGLYTHVEYVGKEYLVQRGWDKDSRLYKAENFFFRNDSELALDAAGEPLDEDAFESILEIKRGDDHTKLITMLEALNNPALDFQTDVFDQYFSKNNYLSWLAVNILLDNYDTNLHNYYLFNPKGSQKFYLLPWDYDLSLGALADTNPSQRTDLPRWTQSHANWWGQELHQQFLRQPGNLDLLKEAMQELKSTYFTAAKLQQKADSYYNVVFPLISSSPDINNLYLGGSNPEKIAAYNRIFSSLAAKVEDNYNQFVAKIGDPMPFVLQNPTRNTDGSYTFKWSDSESLFNQTIRYDLEVSNSANFESGTIILSRNGIQGTEVSIPWVYATGDYFYRVIARDVGAPTQYWQTAYNYLQGIDGAQLYGLVPFSAIISDNNPAPVGFQDTASTTQDTSVTINVLANDTGSGLVLTSNDQYSSEGGFFRVVNNQISYTPKSGFSGTDRLWYQFRDSQGRSNYSSVTITVAADSYPVATPETVSTGLNEAVTINVLANDTGSGLYISSTTNGYSLNGGTVAIVNNQLFYTPKSGFSGEDRLWYIMKDSQGRANSARVTINVTNTPSYPVGVSDFITTIAYTPVTIDALANDTGSGLSLLEVNEYSVNGGTVSIVSGKLRYDPKDGFRGTDSFWYAFTDSLGRSNAAKVTVTVY